MRDSGVLSTVFVTAAIPLASMSALVLFLRDTSGYYPHLPIYIVSDVGFTSEDGMTRGSGTESDPCVIEDRGRLRRRVQYRDVDGTPD